VTEIWPYLSVLMGVAFIVGGAVFVTGRARSQIATTYSSEAPPWLRNGPSILLPSGILFVLTGFFGLAYLGRILMPGWALWVLAILMLAAAFATIRWAYSTPSWLKPAWLRDKPNEDHRSRPQRYLDSALGWTLGGAVAVILGAVLVLGLMSGFR
jgi:hypothetical protein